MLEHNFFIRSTSKNSETAAERLRVASERDGMFEAEEKAEEKRQEDERWARFKDENPRGAGNTMNRG